MIYMIKSTSEQAAAMTKLSEDNWNLQRQNAELVAKERQYTGKYQNF
jgi:hypothetical protein